VLKMMSGDLDLLDLVAGDLERCRDRAHRLCTVVLGFLLGLADVSQPEVVRERDLHLMLPGVAERCDSRAVKGNP
jgi:hypothetical protein